MAHVSLCVPNIWFSVTAGPSTRTKGPGRGACLVIHAVTPVPQMRPPPAGKFSLPPRGVRFLGDVVAVREGVALSVKCVGRFQRNQIHLPSSCTERTRFDRVLFTRIFFCRESSPSPPLSADRLERTRRFEFTLHTIFFDTRTTNHEPRRLASHTPPPWETRAQRRWGP